MSEHPPVNPDRYFENNTYLVRLKRLVHMTTLAIPFFFFSPLFGQSYLADIQKISVEDGLSSRFVTSLCQDSQGFMWIGTRHGLSRYDGYQFKLYTTENNALSTNDIKKIYEGEDQKLLVIHNHPAGLDEYGAIDLLDLKTGEIQTFDEAFRDVAPFKAKDVKHVYSNVQGTLISTRQGILYRHADRRFAPIFTAPGQNISVYHTDGKYISVRVDGKEWLILDLEGRIIEKMPLKSGKGRGNSGWGIMSTMWFVADEGKKMWQFDKDEKNTGI